jgi:cytochrome P450
MEKVYESVDLDEQEIYGVNTHVVAHIRLFENYLAQYRLSTMDDNDWAAMRKLIARHLAFAPYRNAFEGIREMCNSSFVEEMDRIIGATENDA